MGSVTYNLTEGKRIEQGYDYGPFVFKFREDDFETLTLEVTAVGAAGDTISVTVFASNSDRPELETTVSHTVLAADTPTTVAAALAALLNAVAEVYTPPEDKATLYSITATSSAAVVTFFSDEPAFHLDASRAATGAATADLSVLVVVLVDLTGAVVEAAGKIQASDETKLFDWSSEGASPQFTISDPTRGVVDLAVPDTETILYTWTRGRWELGVATATDTLKRPYFTGDVENRLTLL